MCFDEFSLAQKEQNDCFLHRADAHRSIIVIKNEHLAVQPPVYSMSAIWTIEDKSPPLSDKGSLLFIKDKI